MSSPFQRAFSAKSPISKALIGNQKNLPDHLKDKIKDAPENPEAGDRDYEGMGNRFEANNPETGGKDYEGLGNAAEAAGSPAKMGGYEGGGVPANGGYVSNKQDYQRMFNKIEAGTKEFMTGQKKEKDYQRDLKEKERQMKFNGSVSERDGPPKDACGSLFTGPCPKPGDTETNDPGSLTSGKTGGSGGSGGGS
jgi:hypothetical protein